MLNISIEGGDRMLQQIQQHINTIGNDVSNEVHAAGLKFEAMAKQNLINAGNSDNGGLVDSIKYKKIDDFNCEVTANKFYAAYIEFGTKGNYKPIPGAEDAAAAARGKRAGGAGLFAAILAWAKRRNIGGSFTKSGRASKSKSSQEKVEAAAFLIARSIARHGVKPHPFFYRNVAPVRDSLIANLKRIVSGLR